MDAQVGDRVVVEGHHVGAPRRAGTVVEALGVSASARYRVQWDDGHETVFCPGSDARVERRSQAERSGSARQAITEVELRLEETDDHTDAWVTLRTPAGPFRGWGRARRNPVDENIPLVGEELAAARALIDLADSLRSAAGEVIEGRGRAEGHLVS
ncbi:MAG: dsRBD fold-containing protein [Acidimicrobiales bacterium]